jgi:hypothetical protein
MRLQFTYSTLAHTSKSDQILCVLQGIFVPGLVPSDVFFFDLFRLVPSRPFDHRVASKLIVVASLKGPLKVYITYATQDLRR